MPSTSRWRFGPFEVDAQEHRLLRGSEPVAVTRKALALLVILLGRPGKLFTKAELFETVWAGTVVSDAALSRAIRELRVVLGDDAGAPRYIATVHGLGFRFVAAIEIDPEPSQRPLAEPSSSPAGFVARADELALLDAALAAARAGQRQVVFVTGEAGIGKTALVEAFLERHAARDDLWAAAGRCIEQYGPRDAFLPLLEALENLTRQVGAAPLRDVLARYAPNWLALLPWLGEAGELSQRRAAEATAHGMLREIAHALEVLAAQRPLVIWLEDLHWSDPSSLDVVSFLAGRREPARLLLVASFRPADARTADSPLHGLALRLCQRGQAEELALDLLDRETIADLLRLRFGAAALDVDALAVFLHLRTEGNALFVVSIVDDLVRRGVLRCSAGVWALAGSIDALGSELPATLRHLVHQQIEQLSAKDRQLLEAAAVAGADFSAAAVAAALQLETAAVEDRCAILAEQGRFFRLRSPVAWPDGTVSAGFAFLHALYWHGTHERVAPTRRAQWQCRIGLRVEQAYAADRGPVAAELAMRFQAGNDLERALLYLKLAGSGALARAAYREGIDHFRHLLTLLPGVAPERRMREELDALLPLGGALMAVEGYASAEVESTYRRALEIGSTFATPGELTRIRRGLWNVLFSRAELDRARVAAEELMALAGTDAGAAFDALAKLGHTCLHSGDFVGARSQLERALAMADALGPAAAREAPRLVAYLSWALWYLGEPDQALARSDESLASTAQGSRPHTRALVLGHATFIRLLRGERAEAMAHAAEQCRLGAEHDLPYWIVWGRFLIDYLGAVEGDPRIGAAAMRAGIEAMRRLGTMVGITSWMYLLAEVELLAGRPDEARAALAESSDRMSKRSRARNAAETARAEGMVALAAGPGPAGQAEARRCFEAALAIARAQDARSLELRALMSLLGVAAEGSERERALAELGRLRASFTEGFGSRDLRQADALLEEGRALLKKPA